MTSEVIDLTLESTFDLGRYTLVPFSSSRYARHVATAVQLGRGLVRARMFIVNRLTVSQSPTSPTPVVWS